MESPEHFYEFLPVRMCNIITDHEFVPYQRPFKIAQARKIAREWDTLIIDPLVVNVREDGGIYLIRGQHRRAAAIIKFGMDDVELRCRVYYGLTLEEEARIYHQEDKVRRRLSATDTWEAGIISRDPRTIAIIQMGHRHGIKIGPKLGAEVPNHLVCISALEHAYDMAPYLLDNILWLMKAAGWFEIGAPRAEIVRGLEEFLSIYRAFLPPRQKLVPFLEKIGYYNLYNDARLLAQVEHCRISEAVRRTLVKAYDGRKNYANRLDVLYNEMRENRTLENARGMG